MFYTHPSQPSRSLAYLYHRFQTGSVLYTDLMNPTFYRLRFSGRIALFHCHQTVVCTWFADNGVECCSNTEAALMSFRYRNPADRGKKLQILGRLRKVFFRIGAAKVCCMTYLASGRSYLWCCLSKPVQQTVGDFVKGNLFSLVLFDLFLVKMILFFIIKLMDIRQLLAIPAIYKTGHLFVSLLISLNVEVQTLKCKAKSK